MIRKAAKIYCHKLPKELQRLGRESQGASPNEAARRNNQGFWPQPHSVESSQPARSLKPPWRSAPPPLTARRCALLQSKAAAATFASQLQVVRYKKMIQHTADPSLAPPPPPAMSFEVAESLADWTVPASEWLAKHDRRNLDGLASGNFVFNCEGKILLIQRASHDSMPDRWEVPGGAVDDEDASVLHGAARELWEEAGLVAKRFSHVITEGPGQAPGQIFTNRHGTRTFCRFAFAVQVESCEPVKLDPNEHQDFWWASEEEVRDQKVGDKELKITHDGVRSLILEAFRLRREES